MVEYTRAKQYNNLYYCIDCLQADAECDIKMKARAI